MSTNFQTLRESLKRTAEKIIGEDNDDFIVEDYAGGNFDDAYSMGAVAGEVQLARELVDKLDEVIEVPLDATEEMGRALYVAEEGGIDRWDYVTDEGKAMYINRVGAVLSILRTGKAEPFPTVVFTSEG